MGAIILNTRTITLDHSGQRSIAMRRVLLVLVLICLIGPAGCASRVHKEWVAVSGSGTTVKLAYEHWSHEIPTTYEPQGLDLAKKYCLGWGYTDAEAFGGEVRDCIRYAQGLFGQGPCQTYRVTKEYNCVGRQEALVPTEKTSKKK